MIDWEYIQGKRAYYESIYAKKLLIALRKTITPVIQESRISITGELPIDELIKDNHIRKTYIDLYLRIGKAFIKDFLRKLKSFEDDIWEMEMMRLIEGISENKIRLVTNYTKETIWKVIEKLKIEQADTGLSVGGFMKKLRKELTQGDYATFTKARALRIAKTETMTASNFGSYVAAGMSGARMKVWITAPFGVAKTERHNLLGMNDQERPMDQPFDVGGIPMSMPGDPAGGAENVINCNCGMSYK